MEDETIVCFLVLLSVSLFTLIGWIIYQTFMVDVLFGIIILITVPVFFYLGCILNDKYKFI